MLCFIISKSASDKPGTSILGGFETGVDRSVGVRVGACAGAASASTAAAAAGTGLVAGGPAVSFLWGFAVDGGGGGAGAVELVSGRGVILF